MRKFKYYLSNSIKLLIPNTFLRKRAEYLIAHRQADDYIQDRVNYYNKLSQPFHIDSTQSTLIAQFKKTGGTTYFFDLRKVVKCFPSSWYFNYINGDVSYLTEKPCFLKSRPITEENINSILLKLNEIRHFKFIDDSLSFCDKQDMVVWRGLGKKPHRKVVLEQFYDHPMCNIGRIAPIEGLPYEKEFLSIEQQLQYKFILAIEGNDVASNLKWVMSSNSLAVMSKPKFETWFMEGRLEAGVHYIEVKDDYSDLIEKIEYYLAHPNEAEKIIANAHAWIEQFKNPERERLISLLVANKYFEYSGQKYYKNNA